MQSWHRTVLHGLAKTQEKNYIIGVGCIDL